MVSTIDKGKVLIIEDTAGYRRVYHDILTAEGYQVSSADDGKHGLQLAKNEKPDLILLDLVLPGMHGFDVLNEVRKDERTKHIPVVILSVLSEGEKVRTAMKLGANDYAVKGKIKPIEVLEKVQMLIAEAKLKEKWIEASASSNDTDSAGTTPSSYIESNRIMTCPVCRGEMVMSTNSGSGPVVVCPRCESQY